MITRKELFTRVLVHVPLSTALTVVADRRPYCRMWEIELRANRRCFPFGTGRVSKKLLCQARRPDTAQHAANQVRRWLQAAGWSLGDRT